MKEHKVNILMVDDDAEDRDLLKDIFDELGYGQMIHFEDNGEKGIQFLQTCIENKSIPCLVILDLNMPRLNGKQALRFIRSHPALKDVSVVIYSTSLNPFERDECLALGAHSYVIKPVSYAESVAIAHDFYEMCD